MITSRVIIGFQRDNNVSKAFQEMTNDSINLKEFQDISWNFKVFQSNSIKQADGDNQFIVRGLSVVRQRRLQRFCDFFWLL